MSLRVARCPLLAQRFPVCQMQFPSLQSRPMALSAIFSRPHRLPESSIPAQHRLLLRLYLSPKASPGLSTPTRITSHPYWLRFLLRIPGKHGKTGLDKIRLLVYSSPHKSRVRNSHDPE
jgi:hypothetical protein